MKLFLLLASVFVCGQHGLGGAFRVAISPSEFHTKRPPCVVTISCLPCQSMDTDIKEIMILEVSRQDNDDSPIAILRQSSDISNHTTSNYQVKGHIDKVPSKSYLTLTLLNPEEKDTGSYAYQCVMYYVDMMGEMKEKRKSANLTVVDKDIYSVVEHLLHKVFEMDEELKNKTTQMSVLEAALHNQVSEQRQRETDLKDKVTSLQTDRKEQKTKTAMLENKLQNQISETRQTEEELRKKISILESTLQIQISKENDISAFSARYAKRGSENPGDTIIFNDLIMKVGKGYDESTGLYTAPKPGVYGFSVVVMVADGDNFVDLALFVNDKREASLSVSASTHQWGQSSTSTMVQLQTNDKVKVAMIGKSREVPLRNGDYTIFTGYLLHETSSNIQTP